MTSVVRPRHSIRFRGRSFLAFVLAPEPPLGTWLSALDNWLKRSVGFFVGRPVVLDVSGVALNKSEFAGLIADLQARDIRIMGVEGADPSCLGLGLPPLISGGRPAGIIEVLDAPSPDKQQVTPPKTTCLLLEKSVRSGQSVVFPNGDVTVVGSVASGAEVIAGGSIHIYGALRGRAIAGSTGNARARIFCRKIEGELLAIDGLYKTADDMPPNLRSRPIQAWLEGETMMITALD